ncbi:MAG: aspartyl protease family protein [Marinicellaceae bacterium]
MKIKNLMFVTIVLLVFTDLALSQLIDKANGVFNTKPEILNKDYKTVIPIETWNNKIFLTAKVNGKPFRFILDTGSPTILTTKVANELGLEVLGENTGQDANGNLVKMNLSILNKMELGDITIQNIPVFLFDPSNLEVGSELFDGGIIGSEIMPLTNWQINFNQKHIILTDDTSQLNFIKKTKTAPLKVYNYPFMPIIEFEVNNKFKDNALFDTGSTELLQLFDSAFIELKKQKLLNSDSQKANGIFGESGGGRGKDQEYYLTTLKKLSIGELDFKKIKVWTRPHAPSLIGARIFESHVVTLDYKNKIVYFYPYQKPLAMKYSFGFKTYIKDQSVFVGFLIDDSPAYNSGLKLHDRILQINETDLRDFSKNNTIQILTWLSQVNEKSSITVKFISDGDEKTVTLIK